MGDQPTSFASPLGWLSIWGRAKASQQGCFASGREHSGSRVPPAGVASTRPAGIGSDPTLLVELRAHGRSRPVCSGRGRHGPGYDTLDERRFEFVPLWAIPVFFLYRMRRVHCPRCGVKVEKVPWADGEQSS